jgi:NADH-quinone oxidoreductase subunit M
MVQRILYGEVDKEENRTLADIGTRERLVLAPALIMIVLIGVYPQPFLSRTAASVDALIEQVERRAVSAPAAMGAADVRFDRMPILGIDE